MLEKSFLRDTGEEPRERETTCSNVRHDGKKKRRQEGRKEPPPKGGIEKQS